MLKLFTLFIALTATVNTSKAAFNESKKGKNETFYTFSPALENVLAGWFANLSRKEYEQLTGRHLSLLERFAFKIALKRTNKNFEGEKQSKGFNTIGFFAPIVLGAIGIFLNFGGLLWLLLGLFGVGGTYAFSKDKNMRKWAWIGFGTFIVSLIVFVIVILANGYFG